LAVTHVRETFTATMVLLQLFIFESGDRTRRTDERDPQCSLLQGWPHNNNGSTVKTILIIFFINLINS